MGWDACPNLGKGIVTLLLQIIQKLETVVTTYSTLDMNYMRKIINILTLQNLFSSLQGFSNVKGQLYVVVVIKY